MSIIEAIAAEKWAITEEGMKAIIMVAERKGDPEALAAKLGKPLENAYRVEVRDGVAILPVRGPLFRYANLFTAISGASSYQMLARDFAAAMESPETRSVLLMIDSPGGMVNGCHELAEMIHSARGKKPVVAYVGGMGCSAAYWLASAADEIVADPTAMLGSIGVLLEVRDTKEQDAKNGVRVHQFVSSQSPKKCPDPGQESGRAQYQADIDALAQVFVERVARNRGVSAETVLSKFGGGGVLVGADAVAAGLADRLGSFEDVLAGLAQGKGSGSNPNGRKTMPKSYVEALGAGEVVAITADELRAKHPDLVQAIAAEGAAKAKAEGAQAERERIQGVLAVALPGHEAMVQGLAFDGKTSPGEAAMAVNKAEKEAQAAALKGRQADGKALEGVRDGQGAADGGLADGDAKPGALAAMAKEMYGQAAK
ncbi:MAG: S49 family peptidase [Thermodesulfobacteriota bacterium]